MLRAVGSRRSTAGLVVAVASSLVAVALGVAVAPSASAINACLGQTFNTFSSSTNCVVEVGQTVAFTIRAGAGGDGAGTGQYSGGLGGLGGLVTGTYTNTSGSQETMTVNVGSPGVFGVYQGAAPTAATDDSIAVGATVIAVVTGGGGATNATPNANGTNGTNGGLSVPAQTPAGWTVTAAGGPPFVTFTSPTPPTPAPVFPPGAPINVKATAGDARATVEWSAPTSVGSYPITNYQVTSTPSNRTCLVSAPALSCEVTGLINGGAYMFTVQALNGAGWGPSSDPSNVVRLPVPTPKSIMIAGSRVPSDLTTIRVYGKTTGLVGAEVTPWFKYAGQTQYNQGVGTRTVNADGGFTWTRQSNKRTYIYFTCGSVRSNLVSVFEP